MTVFISQTLHTFVIVNDLRCTSLYMHVRIHVAIDLLNSNARLFALRTVVFKIRLLRIDSVILNRHSPMFC